LGVLLVRPRGSRDAFRTTPTQLFEELAGELRRRFIFTYKKQNGLYEDHKYYLEKKKKKSVS
jgi:hypothetical protein